MSVCNEHSKLGPSTVQVYVCLSVVQYGENNFWVGLLSLYVLVLKLSHVEMQSYNLAGWSTMFSLSLFHYAAFAAQFWDLNTLPYPDSYKVKKYCNLQNSSYGWFQEKSEERLCFCTTPVWICHTLHARLEYCMIRNSVNKSIFLKVYVTDKMQCNTFTCGSKFIAKNMQFSHLSCRRGFFKYHDGQWLAVTLTTINALTSGRS